MTEPLLALGMTKSRCMGPCGNKRKTRPAVVLVPAANVTDAFYKNEACSSAGFVRQEPERPEHSAGAPRIAGFSFCSVPCAMTAAGHMYGNHDLAERIKNARGRLERKLTCKEALVVSVNDGEAAAIGGAAADGGLIGAADGGLYDDADFLLRVERGAITDLNQCPLGAADLESELSGPPCYLEQVKPRATAQRKGDLGAVRDPPVDDETIPNGPLRHRKDWIQTWSTRPRATLLLLGLLLNLLSF